MIIAILPDRHALLLPPFHSPLKGEGQVRDIAQDASLRRRVSGFSP